MGVLGAFFGCRGDGGFNDCCSGASIGDGGFTLVCISGRCGDGGFKVATLLRLVREKVRPAALCHRESAKKFALRGHNGSKLAFSGVLGDFFRGNVAGGAVLGEVFRGNAAGGAVLGEFFRANRP